MGWPDHPGHRDRTPRSNPNFPLFGKAAHPPDGLGTPGLTIHSTFANPGDAKAWK